MDFYLGSHLPQWLRMTDTPLFISNRRLYKRKSFPRALGIWALDSGGFSELSMFGEWRTSPPEYVRNVRRYASEIGNMQWAAIQDWMCEPFITAKTGKTVFDHQLRTIDNYFTLKSLAPEIHFIPVLQGWELSDYDRHVDMYAARGVDLRTFDTVGIGSVCRRQASDEIADIIKYIAGKGIQLHGFGVKKGGLKKIASYLRSADSMAWSFAARRDNPLPTCTHPNCANCIAYAERWYVNIMETIDESLLSRSDTSLCGSRSEGMAALRHSRVELRGSGSNEARLPIQ